MAMSAADNKNICLYAEENDSQLIRDVIFMLTVSLVGVLGWFVNSRINRYMKRVTLHQKLEEKIHDDEGAVHFDGATELVEERSKGAAQIACEAVDASAEQLQTNLAFAVEPVVAMDSDGATEASYNSSKTEERSSTVACQDNQDDSQEDSQDDAAASVIASEQISETFEACSGSRRAEIPLMAEEHADDEMPDVLQDLKVLEVVMMAGVGAYVEESRRAMNTDEVEANLDAPDAAANGIHEAVCSAQRGEFRAARLQIISTCRSLLRIEYCPEEREAYVSFFERAEKVDWFMRDMEEGICSISFEAPAEADLSTSENDSQAEDGMSLGASAFQPESASVATIIATITTAAESSVDGPTAAVQGITKAAQLANTGEYRAAGMEIIKTNRLLQQIMRFPEHHGAYMLFIERAEKVETFINERMTQEKADKEALEQVQAAQDSKEKAESEGQTRGSLSGSGSLLERDADEGWTECWDLARPAPTW